MQQLEMKAYLKKKIPICDCKSDLEKDLPTENHWNFRFFSHDYSVKGQ